MPSLFVLCGYVGMHYINAKLVANYVIIIVVVATKLWKCIYIFRFIFLLRKYYLVDVGYPQWSKYLRPYKGER